MNAGANKQKIDGQPFPKSGGLFKNSDLRLEQLKQKLEIKNQSRSKAEVYAYILSTVSSGKHESRFLQLDQSVVRNPHLSTGTTQ